LITYQQAQKICTDSEFTIFKFSEPGSIETLTLVKLNSKAKLARKLQDKWSAKLIEQKRKSKTSNVASDLTISKEKAALFKEVTKRYEKKAKELQKQAEKDAKALLKKKPIDFKSSNSKSTKTETTKGTKAQRFTKSVGHAASRTKKKQAKRDAR
jgi:hypothetical protein